MEFLAGDESKKIALTERELENLKFSFREFDNLVKKTEELVLTLPTSAATRKRARSNSDNSLDFKEFKEKVFSPFATEMAQSLSDSMKSDPICHAFQYLDARNFPMDDLESFRMEDLSVLGDWYGVGGTSKFPSEEEVENKIFVAPPAIDSLVLEDEYLLFKETAKDLKAAEEIQNRKEIESIEEQLNDIKRSRHSRRDAKRLKILETKLKELNRKNFTLKDC